MIFRDKIFPAPLESPPKFLLIPICIFKTEYWISFSKWLWCTAAQDQFILLTPVLVFWGD
jgi:hypothetical protein